MNENKGTSSTTLLSHYISHYITRSWSYYEYVCGYKQYEYHHWWDMISVRPSMVSPGQLGLSLVLVMAWCHIWSNIDLLSIVSLDVQLNEMQSKIKPFHSRRCKQCCLQTVSHSVQAWMHSPNSTGISLQLVAAVMVFYIHTLHSNDTNCCYCILSILNIPNVPIPYHYLPQNNNHKQLSVTKQYST